MPDERRTTRLGLPSGLRFSIAELSAVLLFACFAAAALKSGGWLAIVLAQTAIVLFLAFAVSAAVTRGVARAFAIGFLIGALGHGLPLLYFGSAEFIPETVQWPASKIAAAGWHALEPIRYVVPASGKEVSEDELRTEPIYDAAGYMRTQLQWSWDGSAVEIVERPPRIGFMLAAHAFFATTLGYALGKFGSSLYRRRRDEEAGRSVTPAATNEAL